ncbi:MAG: 2-oxoacid:acceptor oxidoreductase family protein [Planctomycetota bacterium]|jgi:2-oxoglutarate ferredoxin oxidoreductase subunit gamma|nr:2-oxoacid:acceptor oxidoreductase family protein [Planctomycetota bacterium]MDP7133578.1 2-oxoacid:acceptor oxidoreductase family protein [Planctomycetota bacterium]MDP7248835.1 2-oxoacid:acceptor oxidoreductase family protein [Planctomycetota bacterium]
MSLDSLTITERNVHEIRFCGFGGQGVILAGYITGKAVAIIEDRHATLTRSFGPESRGGACAASVVIGDERVDYPFLHKLDILVAMSQAAYLENIDQLVPGGTLIYERDLVELDKPRDGIRACGVPATKIAVDLGKRIVLNIVMLGFFTEVTKVISPDSMREALLDSVPPGTEELNINAFNRGYEFGAEHILTE